jgi:hypothetical protein
MQIHREVEGSEVVWGDVIHVSGFFIGDSIGKRESGMGRQRLKLLLKKVNNIGTGELPPGHRHGLKIFINSSSPTVT